MTHISNNPLPPNSIFRKFEKIEKPEALIPEETLPPTESQDDNDGKIPSGDVLSKLEGLGNGIQAHTEPMTIDPLTRKMITASEFKEKYGDGSQIIYVKVPGRVTEYTEMTVEEYRKKYYNAANPPEAFAEKPVIKQHTYPNKLQELGFTEKEIEKYFDKHEEDFWGTTYTLKDDITVKVRNPRGGYDTIKIDTVEKLMEYMGIDSRNELKEKGLTDEVIDKYFGLMLNMGNGKATYGLDFDYQDFAVLQKTDGGATIIFYHSTEQKATVVELDKDGNIVSETTKESAHEPRFTRLGGGTIGFGYNLDELKSKGFTEEEIEKWFDKKDSDTDPNSIESLNKGYTLKDDITVKVRNPRGGYDTVKIDTVEKLMEYMGIDSRNKLKEKGLTDEVIDKYFGLMLNMGNGKATYGLDFDYQNFAVLQKTDGGATIIFYHSTEQKATVVEVDKDGHIVSETTKESANEPRVTRLGGGTIE